MSFNILFIFQNKTQCVVGINENWFEFDALCSTKEKRPWVVFFVVEHGFERVQSRAFDFVKTTTRGHRWRPSLRAGWRLSPPQSTKVVFFRNKKRRECVFFYLSGLTLYEPRQTQTRSNSHQINPMPMKWSKNLHKNTFVLWQ